MDEVKTFRVDTFHELLKIFISFEELLKWLNICLDYMTDASINWSLPKYDSVVSTY